MLIVVVGVALIIGSVAGFCYMRYTRSELHAMIGTETLSIPELEDLRKISDELGATGGFRKITEVVGAAHPGPAGPLISEVSRTPCVWYRCRIDREYEYIEHKDDGKREVHKRREKVRDYTSSNGYSIIDPQGRTIGVAPAGKRPEGAEKTVDTFQPAIGGATPLMEFVGSELDALRTESRDTTLGYHYQEWLVRPGTQLYVLGEVTDATGALVIGKPKGRGHFIVATKTEEELRADRVLRHRFLAVGVIATFVLGIALLVIGFIR